ncbi:unnamed protein product [Heterobilharzia americana]|nr:unnamed protein product [Heterobilharzia americana]
MSVTCLSKNFFSSPDINESSDKNESGSQHLKRHKILPFGHGVQDRLDTPRGSESSGQYSHFSNRQPRKQSVVSGVEKKPIRDEPQYMSSDKSTIPNEKIIKQPTHFIQNEHEPTHVRLNPKWPDSRLKSNIPDRIAENLEETDKSFESSEESSETTFCHQLPLTDSPGEYFQDHHNLHFNQPDQLTLLCTNIDEPDNTDEMKYIPSEILKDKHYSQKSVIPCKESHPHLPSGDNFNVTGNLMSGEYQGWGKCKHECDMELLEDEGEVSYYQLSDPDYNDSQRLPYKGIQRAGKKRPFQPQHQKSIPLFTRQKSIRDEPLWGLRNMPHLARSPSVEHPNSYPPYQQLLRHQQYEYHLLPTSKESVDFRTAPSSSMFYPVPPPSGPNIVRSDRYKPFDLSQTPETDLREFYTIFHCCNTTNTSNTINAPGNYTNIVDKTNVAKKPIDSLHTTYYYNYTPKAEYQLPYDDMQQASTSNRPDNFSSCSNDEDNDDGVI